MAAERSAREIRAEIDQARQQLAVAIDELNDRLAPSVLAERGKAATKQWLRSPKGIAVVGGATTLIALIMIRNLRRSRR